MFRKLVAAILPFALFACGGGGSSSDGGVIDRKIGSDAANFGCDGGCANQNLTTEDVSRLFQQAIAASQVLGVASTIAITDRVGNVLGVYQMPGATTTTTIDGQIGAVGGLEGVTVPASLAAISKAGTGAYLSSQGNAFSTRTASQIIQEHFNPGERFQFGGPLFGVQFSQLICSDVTTINPSLSAGINLESNLQAAGLIGPRPMPLGLSADPGGIPIYKQGDVVGGIGIELDGEYRLDRNVSDTDDDIEERIALMAQAGGFEIPSERTGNNIFVAGKSLRTVDLSYDDLDALPDALPALDPANFLAITFYTDGTLQSGATFGTPASGIARTSRAGVSAAVLVDAAGNVRYPTRAGTPLPNGIELQPNEVEAILDGAILTAFRARAAIRRPLDSLAHVSIWVVDTAGVAIGMVRTSDAPVFGIDVALQKARTAAFFSSTDAGDVLNQVRARNAVGGFDDYVSQVRNFLQDQSALTGTHAFSDRAGGNMSRPFFVDGIDGNPNGPFSHPFPGTAEGRTWSPFNTGLQLDLVFQRLVQPLGIPQNPPASVTDTCTDQDVLGSRLANGIQIFPGSVPLYRGTTLIGGIGISGDGVDQDDLIAFYGVSRLGLDYAGHTDVGDAAYGFNAPPEIRADNIEPGSAPGTRLRFVNCPEGPFRGSNEQKVCNGL